MTRLVLAFAVGMAFSCSALGPPLVADGTNQIEILWEVPSNHYPSSVWVYRVIPQKFAPAVVSNLMVLGSFTSVDRINLSGTGHLDKRVMYFSNPSETKHLGVFETLGWIDYEDLDAVVSMEDRSPATVPSEQECLELALSWLPRLGIDRSELARVGPSEELRAYRIVRRRGWLDQASGKNAEEVILRGVSFIRRVDGIEFDGIGYRGGVSISFGNDGRIAKLEVIWRHLERSRLNRTLTATEIADAVRSGKARWQPPVPDQHGVRRITITDVMMLYRGKNGDEEQKFIEPYARLATMVDYGHTNVIANLECPILETMER